MDIFCKECAARPGWPFDEAKILNHACQRCFRYLPCNDYGYRKPQQNIAPAPSLKDLQPGIVPNPHSQTDLPKAKDTRTEADKVLDALQPNRPGIKLETKKK